MRLLSPSFAALTAGTFILYYLTPRRYRFLTLLAAGLLFFGSQGMPVLFGTAGDVLVCWLAGRVVEGRRESGRPGGGRRETLLFLGVQLALFLCFHGRWPGFSFLTLLLSAYILDVYRGKLPAEKRLLPFASFGLFFLPGSQGPVSRYQETGPQLLAGEGADWPQICDSLRRILWGLLKKLVLADRLAIFVDRAYAGYGTLPAGTLWLAVLFYSIQIYADFSGCMDLVLGAAGLFGIRLPENFRRPYLADSFQEYWRRWHITMGVWFREYVFYPLAVSGRVIRWGRRLAAGARTESGRRRAAAFLPLLLTWLATGLWHGPAGHYMLWGAVNGLLILRETGKKPEAKGTGGRLRHAAAVARTFFVISLVRILFRADSAAAAWGFVRRLFCPGAGGGVDFCGLSGPELLAAAVGSCILAAVDIWQERRGGSPLKGQPWPVRWLVCLAGIAVLLVFGVYGPGYEPAEFFYGRF